MSTAEECFPDANKIFNIYIGSKAAVTLVFLLFIVSDFFNYNRWNNLFEKGHKHSQRIHVNVWFVCISAIALFGVELWWLFDRQTISSEWIHGSVGNWIGYTALAALAIVAVGTIAWLVTQCADECKAVGDNNETELSLYNIGIVAFLVFLLAWSSLLWQTIMLCEFEENSPLTILGFGIGGSAATFLCLYLWVQHLRLGGVEDQSLPRSSVRATSSNSELSTDKTNADQVRFNGGRRYDSVPTMFNHGIL